MIVLLGGVLYYQDIDRVDDPGSPRLIQLHGTRGNMHTLSREDYREWVGKHPEAADALRMHCGETHAWRRAMSVRHYDGKVTYWDKAWLSELACKSWYLMPRTGRLIAAELEEQLRCANKEIVSRGELVEMVNRCVTELGIGDAVPVAV